jgi:hypothetical protein
VASMSFSVHGRRGSTAIEVGLYTLCSNLSVAGSADFQRMIHQSSLLQQALCKDTHDRYSSHTLREREAFMFLIITLSAHLQRFGRNDALIYIAKCSIASKLQNLWDAITYMYF